LLALEVVKKNPLCDRNLMQGQPSSWLSRIVAGATALVMFGAAAAILH
jgi:hypothetical protein